MAGDRGGPVDGERSISGRACLPLLAIMIVGLAAIGWFIGAVVQAI